MDSGINALHVDVRRRVAPGYDGTGPPRQPHAEAPVKSRRTPWSRVCLFLERSPSANPQAVSAALRFAASKRVVLGVSPRGALLYVGPS